MRLLYTDRLGTHNIEIKNPNLNLDILERISYLKDNQLNTTLTLPITQHTSRHELMNYIHVLIFVYNGKKKNIEDLLKENGLQANNLDAFELLDERKRKYKEICENDNIFKTFIDEYKGPGKDQMKRECKGLLVKLLTELRNDHKYWIKEKESINKKIQEIKKQKQDEIINKFVIAAGEIKEIEDSIEKNYPKIQKLNLIVTKLKNLDMRDSQQRDEHSDAIREAKSLITEMNLDPEIKNFNKSNPKINPQLDIYKTFVEIIDCKNIVEGILNDYENKIRALFNKNQANQSSLNNQKTNIQIDSIKENNKQQRAEKLKDIIFNANKGLEKYEDYLKKINLNSEFQNLIKQKKEGKLEENSQEYKKACEIINLKNECEEKIKEIESYMSNARNELYSIEPQKTF